MKIINSDISTDEGIMERLQKIALDVGAEDTRIISTDDIIIDPRVRLKCLIPVCNFSGTCSHCPPNGFSVDEVRDIISGYQKAIFFKTYVKNKTIANPKLYDYMNCRNIDDSILTLGVHYLLVQQIVTLLNKNARESGYKPVGFAAGYCRDILCFFQPNCQALTSNKGCRHPDLSNPSMESCSMDVFTMAYNAGWDVYPVGGTCHPDDIPRGSLFGLVAVY